MTRVLTVLAAAAVAIAPTTGVAARQADRRTVYVTATTGKYVPVTDLAASDFVVKEDGKAREVVKAERATVPMHIALMLDNGGIAINAIRQGSGELIAALQGKAEFTIITIGGRALTLVEFTGNVPVLFDGLGKLLARSTTSTDLLDGFLELSAEFQRRKAERPVIIAIATEGEEVSNTRAPVVLEALQKSGARLYYIGLGPPVTQGSRPPLAANKPDSGTESETANRNTVLGIRPQEFRRPKRAGPAANRRAGPDEAVRRRIAESVRRHLRHRRAASQAQRRDETERRDAARAGAGGIAMTSLRSGMQAKAGPPASLSRASAGKRACMQLQILQPFAHAEPVS